MIIRCAQGAVVKGDRVILIDDLVATGEPQGVSSRSRSKLGLDGV